MIKIEIVRKTGGLQQMQIKSKHRFILLSISFLTHHVQLINLFTLI